MGTLDETTYADRARRLHGAGRRRPRHAHAEPRARRAERRPAPDIGAGSSLIAFFRSLGGADRRVGAGRAARLKATSSMAAGLAAPASGRPPARQVPDVSTLPPPVAAVVEHAYGIGIGEIFLRRRPARAGRADRRSALMHEVPLGTSSGIDIAAEARAPGGVTMTTSRSCTCTGCSSPSTAPTTPSWRCRRPSRRPGATTRRSRCSPSRPTCRRTRSWSPVAAGSRPLAARGRRRGAPAAARRGRADARRHPGHRAAAPRQGRSGDRRRAPRDSDYDAILLGARGVGRVGR